MAKLDGPIVGIDLGTTFSAVAVVDVDGVPRVLESRDGNLRTVPSAVYFEPGGVPIVGATALNVAVSEPDRVVQFVKRDMGNPSFVRHFDGREWTAEGISGCILRHMKNLAEEDLGTPVCRAVISVPAYFKDAAKTATKAAGQTAGLEVLALINEPTAAAIAYGLGQAGHAQTVLVYDFGGGTFDVTVLRIEDRQFTVVATDGDPRLGGYNVNERIVEYLADAFQGRHGIDLRQDAQARRALWNQAEQAKISLSGRQSVMIPLSFEQNSFRIDLDRDQFNELIADLVDRTRLKMEAAVESAGLDWSGIDAVLPVGGSSRIQAVRAMIQDVTGKRLTGGFNPDEIVALGAALRAGLTDVTETTSGPAPGTGRPRPAATGIVVRDVAPHSVGVRASDEHGRDLNSIIIPRLTEVPCERTRTYSTVADNQSKIELFILQGEDPDPFSPEVEPIGRLALNSLPARPAGEVLVSVALRYDANGVIEVEAKELLEGQVVRGQLLKKVGELDEELIEAMRSQVVRVGEETTPEPAVDGEPGVEAGGGPAPQPPDGSDVPESETDQEMELAAELTPARAALFIDYYDFLEVSRDADDEALEAALAEQEDVWCSSAEPPSGDDDVVELVRRRLVGARAILLDPVFRSEYDLALNRSEHKGGD